MTQAQIQTKITKMRFTYLGKDEELVLKKVLSEINLATGSGVSSVFGRSGAITAQSGDYSFSQISGMAGPTQGGTGLTTYAKGDVLIATGTNTVGVVAAPVTDGYVFTYDLASGLPMWKAASGGIDTSANYTWTGKHVFTNAISGTGNAFEVNPTLTATANNQTLAAVSISPAFVTGGFTGGTFYGLQINGSTYSVGDNTSGVSYYMGSGKSIRTNVATNGVIYIDAAKDLTGTVNFRCTSVVFNSITMSSNNYSSSGNVNCGSASAGTGYQLAGQTLLNAKSTGTVLRFNDNSTFLNVGMRGHGYQIADNVIPISMVFNNSALLDLNSTTRGFLPPRMTTTQKNAITSPAEGLVLYDNVLKKLCLYNGTAWETITSA